MSFGISIPDIHLAAKYFAKAYRSFSQAFGEHNELTGELHILQAHLRRVSSDIQHNKSLLSRTHQDEAGWAQLLKRCEGVIRELSDLVRRYHGIQSDSKRRRFVKQILFGRKQTAALKHQVMRCNDEIASFSGSTAVSAPGRIEQHVARLREEHRLVFHAANQLLDIHSRQVSESAMSPDDEKNHVWQQFRRHMRRRGVGPEMLDRYQADIKSLIYKTEQDGKARQSRSELQSVFREPGPSNSRSCWDPKTAYQPSLGSGPPTPEPPEALQPPPRRSVACASPQPNAKAKPLGHAARLRIIEAQMEGLIGAPAQAKMAASPPPLVTSDLTVRSRSKSKFEERYAPVSVSQPRPSTHPEGWTRPRPTPRLALPSPVENAEEDVEVAPGLVRDDDSCNSSTIFGNNHQVVPYQSPSPATKRGDGLAVERWQDANKPSHKESSRSLVVAHRRDASRPGYRSTSRSSSASRPRLGRRRKPSRVPSRVQHRPRNSTRLADWDALAVAGAVTVLVSTAAKIL